MFLLQVLLNGFVVMIQVLLLAAGLYLIYRVSRLIHIGLAGTVVASAYAFYALSTAGVPFWLSFLGGLVAAVFLGLIGFYLLRSFADREQELVGLLVSLSLLTILESVLAMLFGSEGRFLISGVLPIYSFGPLYLTQVGFWSIVIGFCIVLIAFFVLYALPVGRVLRAVQQHRYTAILIGIREKTVQAGAFVVASLFAGLIGMLLGMNNAITPLSGLNLVLLAFIALFVGGLHDFRGTVVASVLIVLIPECLTAFQYGDFSISASWKMVLVFVLAFILLLFRPRGLFAHFLRQS